MYMQKLAADCEGVTGGACSVGDSRKTGTGRYREGDGWAEGMVAPAAMESEHPSAVSSTGAAGVHWRRRQRAPPRRSKHDTHGSARRQATGSLPRQTQDAWDNDPEFLAQEALV